MTSGVVLSEVMVGAGLLGIEVARSVPAWLRVRRRSSLAGISAVSTGVLAGSGPAWVAVAVLAHSPAAALASVVWLVFHTLLIREVFRVDPTTRRPIAVSSGTALAVVVPVGYTGHRIGHLGLLLGLTIGVATAAYSLPALISGMTSESTAGLSAMSLGVNTVEGVAYLVAGLGLGGIAPAGTLVAGYVAFGLGAVGTQAPRLVRVVWRRARARDGAHPVLAASR